MSSTRPHVPNRPRITVLALALPLAIAAAAISWAVSFLPQLPDPVATHWGLDGTPDGFGSAAETLWVLAATVVPFTVGMWALGFFNGSAATTRRLSVFMSVWFATAISGLLVGSLAMQRGLTDAARATGVGLPLAISFASGAALGILAVLLVPSDRPQPTNAPIPEQAERFPLDAGEQAAWTRTVELPAMLVVIGVGVGLAGVIGGLALLAGRTTSMVIQATLLVVVLLLVLLGRWTVTVDRDGLTARCMIPRPRTVVPLDEVESAEVIEVQPLADFGGWGYRIATSGRVGIVLRSGEAILVRRTGGRELVITVDDATTGAALLNTLADRARLR